MAKFVPLVDTKLAGDFVEVEHDTQSKDKLDDGEVADNGDNASSDTLEGLDIVHTVGDIVKVCWHTIFFTSQGRI